MRAEFYPLQVLLAGLAGWMNRHQQDVIAYMVEENRVLKEQLKGKSIDRNAMARPRKACRVDILRSLGPCEPTHKILSTGRNNLNA